MMKAQTPEKEQKQMLEKIVNLFKQVPGLKQKYFSGRSKDW